MYVVSENLTKGRIWRSLKDKLIDILPYIQFMSAIFDEKIMQVKTFFED
jgi:hypothetical protein